MAMTTAQTCVATVGSARKSQQKCDQSDQRDSSEQRQPATIEVQKSERRRRILKRKRAIIDWPVRKP
jgi:hypothetical protein